MSDQGTSGYAYRGARQPDSSTSDLHSAHFVAERVVNRVSTATLVKIVKVLTNDPPGKIEPVGFVDVLPLVNQLDGYGKPTPHQTVYGLSYFRLQGGTNAVIMDPLVGDIGIAVFADRDISKVKSTKAQANPGSRRRFDMADGIFFGLCLADKPKQYITFTNDGIQIVDKSNNTITMNTDGVTIVDKSGNKIVMSSSGINLNP